MATKEAIVSSDVRKSYGHIEALGGVNLTVNEGEILGLLGANGAGKTTLIKILIGMTKADSGVATVLGFDPIKQSSDLRQQIGYMPQAPALYEDLTARDNVRFFGGARKIDNLDARLDEVFEFVNLADRQHDPVYGFSGGMKQRVSLACALVHRPKLLFLDEPSTGVDPKLRESLWAHFRELAAQGATILISTHQMDEAFHCDRVALMRAGQVLACDTPRGLMARGKARVTVWRGEEKEITVVDQVADQLPGLLGIEATVSRIEIEEDTLEDVVLSLIDAEGEMNHA